MMEKILVKKLTVVMMMVNLLRAEKILEKKLLMASMRFGSARFTLRSSPTVAMMLMTTAT